MSRRPNGIACPHCAAATRVMDSRAVTPLLRSMRLACRNVECGATFGAVIEITHGISASARPNPQIDLRMAPPRRPANDTSPGPEVPGRRSPANDDTPPPDTAAHRT